MKKQTLALIAVAAIGYAGLGDHATNIAKDVIYMVEAEIIRHQPSS